MEALQLPLECMRNMQNRITIRVNDISESVCSHVITDKQWLQENLLCLLSNAVKYSIGGCVDIRITLQEYMTGSGGSTGSGGKKVDVLHPIQENDDNDDDHGIPTTLDNTTQKVNHNKQLKPFILIEVEDTGIGMSNEAMSSLFNPFKQTQRLAGGTGLGLYSLAKRMDALQGLYGVTNRSDNKQGSLFWFAIPYKPDVVYSQHAGGGGGAAHSDDISLHGTSNKTQDTSHSLTATSGTLHAVVASDIPCPVVVPKQCPLCRILFVDDSPTIVKMSTLMLQRIGHTVTVAENGAVAVQVIEESLLSQSMSFDVILMDLQMYG